MKPRAAARRIDCSLPAATHSGGCGCCAGGGSTTMSSKCQKRPWWEKRWRRRPRPRHHRDRLLEARLGLFRRDLKTLKLAMPVALADAEIEAAAGDQIERRRLLGEQHRIVPGQHDTAEPSRNVVVRMASAIKSIKVADTWFQPVK